MTITITAADPNDGALDELFRRHVQAMHADTPPESIHMLPRGDLARPGIWFFVMRQDGDPVGMGAIKRIEPHHGEIKSMHVLSERRGAGLARKLLDALMDHARAEGVTRLSLETGAQDSFRAARGLYAAAGFTDCPPIVGYGPDENSVFMTRVL